MFDHRTICYLLGLAAAKNEPKQAVQYLDQAVEQARVIRYSRNRVFSDATATWYKSWFPRVVEQTGAGPCTNWTM